jgi:hypothetical protein
LSDLYFLHRGIMSLISLEKASEGRWWARLPSPGVEALDASARG